MPTADCARKGDAAQGRVLVGYSTHVTYFFGKVMDAMPSCVGDAMSSVVDYRVQEFLVDRLFAFLTC